MSESTQLPACLRTVGFLRRINLLSDQELRLTFLQARDVYLQTQLAALPATDPFIFVRSRLDGATRNAGVLLAMLVC